MRNLEQRIHDLIPTEMPIEAFREKLLDRQIMAIRHHARWSARRIAQKLAREGYTMSDCHMFTDTMLHQEFRRFNVDAAIFRYARKVTLEYFKEIV